MGSGSHLSKRKKKRSQKRSKRRSKSSREKTKKLSRRHDSVSCSDDDSPSTSLVSCSSSGDDYRSKSRARSRDRSDRKGRKKRAKRSTSTSESSEDSPRIRKRKRSKRSRNSDSRKKRRVKIRRKERSVSSSSTCEPSSDSEREINRKEEKLEIKERKGREKDKERSGSKRTRHRSRSCSSCSLRSESHSHYSEERVIEENNLKRLKSVIVATKDIVDMKEREEAEVREANSDGSKDEIVYEQDDYPTRSNDSNDGVNRREALPYSIDASCENTRPFEDPKREGVVSDVRTSEISGTRPPSVEKTVGVTSSNVGSSVSAHLKESRNEVSAAKAGSNSDDLAAILRQKALENLLKRRAELPIKKSVTEVKSSSSLRSEPIHHMPDKLPTKNSATEVKSSFTLKSEPVHHHMPDESQTKNSATEVKSSSSLKSEPVHHVPDEERNMKSMQKFKKVDDVKNTTTYAPRSLEDHDVHPPSTKLGTGHPAEKGNANAPANLVIVRPRLGLSTSRKEFHGTFNTWRREAANETKGKDSESPSLDTKRKSAEKVGSDAVSEPSASGGHSSNDTTNKVDEDSQFQQKTMSVMRGGEMVQVSYKVYIPKKAPALARRQLKR